jgi:hypothetical protein
MLFTSLEPPPVKIVASAPSVWKLLIVVPGEP